jgi:hypothetical protein
MGHHQPEMRALTAEFRLMYVSRHIYLLGASLVNTALGLYLEMRTARWQRALQIAGSAPILAAPAVLLIAFLQEPEFGMAGRSWRGYFGLIGLFAGVLAHLLAGVTGRSDSLKNGSSPQRKAN